jgi:Glyoxalase-like domain
MSLRARCAGVDTTDPDQIAPFWAAALGWRQTSSELGDIYAGTAGRQRRGRLHLDLRPDDTPTRSTPQAARFALPP